MSQEDSRGDEMIDVWRITPHYDPRYDYLLTNSSRDVPECVSVVTESWLDSHPSLDETLTITVKVTEIQRKHYTGGEGL